MERAYFWRLGRISIRMEYWIEKFQFVNLDKFQNDGGEHMQQKDYIEMGLNGEDSLKVILRGSILRGSNEPIGVVSLIYATVDKEVAKVKLNELLEKDKESYYMVYSIPLDTDLTTLDHYPSIAITKEDLNQ